ncbi:suppressor of fused domain protein [Nocardioides sp.]|uniref:suppressor of fused domain protein n=1 Tax=Nocardioides sp. TaxID=35761 RepID=UPI0027185D91|nr:suppressor of fused domain protein [Nocardioides sp.]MDO9455981.1 suppressor of fused domain protein [Nocardioides sp.]
MGPISETNPHFRVLRVPPQARGDAWTYITVGGWAATEGQQRGTEFILCTATDDMRAVELLAMTVFYNEGGKLGTGHVLPISEPWLPRSRCDRLLVSLPYPYGPDLQTCHVGDLHVDFLWLIPITEAERDYRNSAGLEALETRFDEVQLAYWDATRASAV